MCGLPRLQTIRNRSCRDHPVKVADAEEKTLKGEGSIKNAQAQGF
jgi:hypothetical protein